MADISVDKIIIAKDRFRDPEKVDALAQSISKFGLLQPIVLDWTNGEHTLVAGCRRLTACKKLGWETIPFVMLKDLDPVTSREIELEENIQREQMTWQERVRAIALIDSLKRARDPKWTQGMTAAVVEAPRQADVSVAVNLDKMLQLFPELSKAKNVNQALQWSKVLTKKISAAIDVADNPIKDSPIKDKILLGDSIDVIKMLEAESFHAVITDPPFGIDYDSMKSGSESSLTTYEDSKESYRRILSMAPDLFRIIKPDGWLIWFLGFSWYEECKETFRSAGFTVDEIPIVWDRSDGRCHSNRPDRYFTKGYDIALHCFKGDPTMPIKNKSNVLRFSPISVEDRELTVERPIELYEELIKRLTIPGQRILDPFTGSGSCLAAAARTKRDFLGIELSEIRRAIAIKKVSAHYSA